MCIDMCIDMRVHMCADNRLDMCADMCSGIRLDKCADVHKDMCGDRPGTGALWLRVQAAVPRSRLAQGAGSCGG